MALRLLLDTLATQVHLLRRQVHDMEGVHHGASFGDGVGRSPVVAGEPVQGDVLDARAEVRLLRRQPGLQGGRGPAGHHVQQPCRTGAVDHRRQVDDHSDEAGGALAAAVFPFVFIHSEIAHVTPVSGLVIDQIARGSQGEVVGQIPPDPQGLGDRGDRHLVDRQTLQDPPGHPPGGRGAIRGRSG